MLRNIGFEIVVADFPNYDYVVAEVYFNGLFVAMISQEVAGQFILEIPGDELVQAAITRKVEWQHFQATVQTACERIKREKDVPKTFEGFNKPN